MFNFQAPRVGVVLTSLLLLAAPAVAQTTTAPSQNADTWGGVRHAPGADLHGNEKAAGVALPPGQRRAQTDEVEQLQQQILQRAEKGTDDGILNGAPAPQPAQ